MGKRVRTRKERIEKDLVPQLVRALQESGSTIYKEGGTHIHSALRSAAMIGAIAERERTLAIIRDARFNRDISNEIISKGVLDVLGYDESSESTAAPSPGAGKKGGKATARREILKIQPGNGGPVPREIVLEIYQLFDHLHRELIAAGVAVGLGDDPAEALNMADKVADSMERLFGTALTAEERGESVENEFF